MSNESFPRDEIAAVSPLLARLGEETIAADLWRREGLSPRDRSLVTIAALIARRQQEAMPTEFARALANGVKAAELSETIAHLAFYSGWGNALAALPAAREVFAQHHVPVSELPGADQELLPLDLAAENLRATSVEAGFGSVSPGVVHYTTEKLFLNLWQRPALAPRDRSLITVSALVAAGQVAQIPYHLNRAMDKGLSRMEVGEMLTQLAFHAGWPCAFSALPVVKAVFAERAK